MIERDGPVNRVFEGGWKDVGQWASCCGCETLNVVAALRIERERHLILLIWRAFIKTHASGMGAKTELASTGITAAWIPLASNQTMCGGRETRHQAQNG